MYQKTPTTRFKIELASKVERHKTSFSRFKNIFQDSRSLNSLKETLRQEFIVQVQKWEFTVLPEASFCK